MSKMDALRAMREARYEQAAKPAKAKAPAAAVATDGVCGHKAIGGRTCTRDAGHSEKSHRYS